MTQAVRATARSTHRQAASYYEARGPRPLVWRVRWDNRKLFGSSRRAARTTSFVEHTAMAERQQARRKARATKRPAKPADDLKREIAALKHELAQALERQAAMSDALNATADMLKVISRSTFDLGPVLATVAATAARLCAAEMAFVSRRDADVYRFVTAVGSTPETTAVAIHFQKTVLDGRPFAVGTGTIAGRVVLEGRALQITDLASDPEYTFTEAVTVAKARTLLGVPLMREGEPIGVLTLARQRVEPFTERQIELVRTFADQAVIAIENARLVGELRERTDELGESEARHALVTQAVAEGIYQWDIESNLLRVTSRLIDILGAYGRGRELLASDWNELVHPEDFPRYKAALRECFKDVTARLDCEYRVRHGDGQYRWVEDRGVPVRNDAGRAVRMVGAITDISERKATEQALRESLEQQTATAEVLQVINSSPGDLAPVFDAMLEKAMGLCDAAMGALGTWQDERFRFVANRGPQPLVEYMESNEVSLGSREGFSRVARGEGFVHFTDVLTSKFYKSGEIFTRALVDLGGARTTLCVPLAKDDTVLGVLAFFRQQVKPFSDKQIALVRNFAAQAVIAMENARLINETRESLEQQTATAEVLQVINSSPGHLGPVFDAMLEKATHLCEAVFGTLWLRDGEQFHAAALHGAPAAYAEIARKPVRPLPSNPLGRMLRGERVVVSADLAEEDPYRAGDPVRRAVVDLAGARSAIQVALVKDDVLLGSLTVYRQEVRPFSDKQIALLQNFAAQAVIAMENARLLGELRQRTVDLQESLEYQTAVSDVLKVISHSTFDLQPVFRLLVENAVRLCGAQTGMIFQRDAEVMRLAAAHGPIQAFTDYVRDNPIPATTATGRAVLEGRTVHILDAETDPEYGYGGRSLERYRTIVAVPLMRGGTPVGVFTLWRHHVQAFTPRQLALVESFADQAVVAIENARLLTELRERTEELARREAELRVTFDNMGDGVAMFDAAARLAAWNRNLQEMLDLPDTVLAKRPSFAELFRYLAARGEFGSADIEAELSRSLEDMGREMRYERTRPDGRVIEVRRNPAPDGGFVVIYSDITERKRAEAAVRAARDAAEAALSELKAAQASLIHAEKMASLGQLTAGIAHEIKNPLNFVNNFAGISVELLDELKDATAQAIGALAAEKRTEIAETIGMLTSNLEKIAEHGRRADGIVKSMLQHSRGGSDDWRATNLNALVEEALNLAYHGARAQDQSFNITLERDLDRSLTPIEVVPQEVTRVFLNLIGNGFYAASKRSRECEGTFRPVLKVSTRELGEAVEIRVRDNGVGIAAEHREKLFQPFFTTKPTGEGTGLGLSISYEIVTQQHGGTITVDSEVDHFTEFTVRLPRRRHSPEGKTA
jgi:PAS domain S-box-containing protein